MITRTDPMILAWKADAKNRAFRYAYDKFGRLSSAVYLEEGVANQHYDEAFTYDKMGNVQSITRYGLHDDNQYELIDNVSLYYNGNQVVHADDAVNDGPNYAGAFHFRDSNGTQWDTEYEYDKNGCLTRDRNKGIWQIQYNLLNLPSKTTFSDGGSINYQYSASGKKQMVWGSAPGQGSKSQFYLGNYVYSNGVKQLLVDGGYVTFSGTTPQYHFYVKDHLGNNRMVVNANGTVEQVSHYYAFGGLMGEGSGSDVQDFKYNGKELDRLHGLDWYDYNARHMDAVRGVFTTMDPLAEKYFDISPYVYCENNPIKNIDPDGRSTKVVQNRDSTYRVIGGDINDKDRNIYLYSKDSKGNYIKKRSIGVSATMTSFYNSDESIEERQWSGTIDPNDNSGIQFLNDIMGENSPNLLKYMYYARNGEKYDFKVTNGTDSKITDDIYRGMPIYTNSDGIVTYASARDVGNMAAGYIVAKNGISWKAARAAFDLYQGYPEGCSSVAAQLYGYIVLGQHTFAHKALRLLNKR